MRYRSSTISFDKDLFKTAGDINASGYRVILVAIKEVNGYQMDVSDEFEGLDSAMIVEGLLTFLDPPKDDAKISIASLHKLGVDVRVLRGDNLGVAMKAHLVLATK